MEEVVAAAQRIERILGEQPDPKIEQIVLSMQDQIRILTKDLKKGARADGVSSGSRYPYRCPCCHTSRNSESCSTAPCRLTACDSQCSPASSRSSTTARYHATATLPTWPPDVSRLWGRRPHADSQTGGLLAVSYAMRRATLPTAALPVPCCSACYGSKPEKPPIAQPEARFLNFQHRRAARAPPRGI